MSKSRASVALAALVAAASIVSASPASAAPKGPWEPVPDSADSTLAACGTTLTISTLVNKERQRVTTAPDGTTTIQVRGALKVLVTAADGRTATVNASGPGDIEVNGNVTEIKFGGRTIVYPQAPYQAAAIAAAGLPTIFVSAGPLRVTEVTDAAGAISATINAPHHVVDVCTLLH